MTQLLTYAVAPGAVLIAVLFGVHALARRFWGDPIPLLQRTIPSGIRHRVASVALASFVSYGLCAGVWWASLALTPSTATDSAVVTPLPSSPAALAGVHDGDQVTAVNGHPIRTFADLQATVAASEQHLDLEVRRNGQASTFALEKAEGRIGVVPQMRPMAPREALGAAIGRPAVIAVARVSGLLAVFQPRTQEVLGPVGLVRAASALPSGASRLALGLSIALSSVLPGYLVIALLDLRSRVLLHQRRPNQAG